MAGNLIAVVRIRPLSRPDYQFATHNQQRDKVERLCRHIGRPRMHLARYPGVFARVHARWGNLIGR